MVNRERDFICAFFIGIFSTPVQATEAAGEVSVLRHTVKMQGPLIISGFWLICCSHDLFQSSQRIPEESHNPDDRK